MPSSSSQKKLEFKVCFRTCEDPPYSAEELNDHKPDTKGWQSRGLAAFPVELGFEFLAGFVQVSQLQILSHECKIATKIEVFIGTGDTYQLANFKRLGYLSLDNNERSNFTARELKSVYISASGTFLKLMVHKCHLNRLNTTNQVGIIAINVLGQPILMNKVNGNENQRLNGSRVSGMGDDHSSHAFGNDESQYSGVRSIRPVAPSQDLAFHMHFDQHTAKLLNDVFQAKQLAVQQENYEVAKNLKEIENDLKAVGSKVVELEAKKAAAVEHEDYDTAMQLKLEIQDLRSSINTDAVHAILGNERHHHHESQQLPPPSSGYFQQPPPHQYSRHHQVHHPEDAVIHRRNGHEEMIKSPANAPTSPSHQPRFPDIHHRHPTVDGGAGNFDSVHGAMGSDDNRPLPALAQSGNRGGSSAPFNSQEHLGDSPGFGNEPPAISDKEMIVSSGRYMASPERHTPRRDEIVANGGVDPLEGVPGAEDLTEPDEIPANMLNDAQPIIRVFGEYIVRCLYSHNIKLRTAAVQKVEMQVTKSNIDPSVPETLSALFAIVRVAINDKIAPYVAGLRLLTTALERSLGTERQSSETPRKNQIHSGLEAILPAIVDKLGDNNNRVRDGSRDILIQLARMENVGAVFVAHHIVRKQRKASRTSNLWKPVKQRLLVMTDIVRDAGVSDNTHNPLSVGQIMQLIADCAGHTHSNIEVRDASKDLTVATYASAIKNGQHPWGVMEGFLADLRPKQMEEYQTKFAQINQDLDYDHGEAAGGQAREAPTASTPNHTPRTNRRRQQMHSPGAGGADRNGNSTPPEATPRSRRQGAASDQQRNTDELTNNDFADHGHVEEAEEDGEALEVEDTCQFCHQHNPDFTDEQLDLHYWRECPMLTSCPQCEQVIEVCMLNEHLLTECEKKVNHKRCPRCGEAIASQYFEQHANRNNCREAKPLSVASRCPLCHKDIPPEQEGWREHLLGGRGCPKNTRTNMQM